MTYNTDGIILKYRDIGEFDRIYSVLTAEHGKIEGWAQGVRKPQSKLVSHLQPLYLCDLMFARGRRFDRVAQVRVLNRWPEIWEDLGALAQAMYAAPLVDLVTRPGAMEKGVFELMLGYMEILSNNVIPAYAGIQKSSEIMDSRFRGNDRMGEVGLLTIFSLKLLKESGFAPQLQNCVLCKAAVEGLSVHFDAGRGGVVCEICAAQGQSFLEGLSLRVSSLTLETLETLLNSPLTRLEMPEVVQRELAKISEAMIKAHFGEEPRARYFVESIVNDLSQMAAV